MSGAPGSIEASRSKTMSKRRQSSRATCPKPSTTPFHSHSDKIEKLSAMDFGPKSKVEEGAVVKLGGRFFVIAVSTGGFVCDGNAIRGISTQAPSNAELGGKRAGDGRSVNGRQVEI